MEPVRGSRSEATDKGNVRTENPGGGAKLLVETGSGGIKAPKDIPAAGAAVDQAPGNTGSQPATGLQAGQQPENTAARPGSPVSGQVKMPATGGSLGSLSKIRQQFAERQSSNETSQSRPLEPEALHKAWQQYADYLRENRNPAVQSLELATLRIVNATSFEVLTHNNLEQKFIEQEKRPLSDHLQKIFSNRVISFSVIVEENAHAEEEPTDRPLNKREQFIQIVEQYPLVKELKDRLRLELDY